MVGGCVAHARLGSKPFLSTHISRRRSHAARICYIHASSTAVKPPKQQMLVYVPPHPLVKHWLSVTRNQTTPPAIFRSACAELGRILVYEAAREWLPTVETNVDTPLGTAEATIVDVTRPIKVVPILRAGLVITEQLAMVLPVTETYHVGVVRDPTSLEPSCYLNKLPERFSEDDLILVTDPLLATGGTISFVLDDIISRGADPSNVRVIAIIAAPPALQKLSAKFPGLKVYTAMIDAELNDKGYIVPGLGDAGDRAYGTA